MRDRHSAVEMQLSGESIKNDNIAVRKRKSRIYESIWKAFVIALVVTSGVAYALWCQITQTADFKSEIRNPLSGGGPFMSANKLLNVGDGSERGCHQISGIAQLDENRFAALCRKQSQEGDTNSLLFWVSQEGSFSTSVKNAGNGVHIRRHAERTLAVLNWFQPNFNFFNEDGDLLKTTDTSTGTELRHPMFMASSVGQDRMYALDMGWAGQNLVVFGNEGKSVIQRMDIGWSWGLTTKDHGVYVCSEGIISTYHMTDENQLIKIKSAPHGINGFRAFDCFLFKDVIILTGIVRRKLAIYQVKECGDSWNASQIPLVDSDGAALAQESSWWEPLFDLMGDRLMVVRMDRQRNWHLEIYRLNPRNQSFLE